MKKVIFDFNNEVITNKNDNNTIVVRPKDFNESIDSADVRQYIIDLAIQSLLEKGEITEGDFEIQGLENNYGALIEHRDYIWEMHMEAKDEDDAEYWFQEWESINNLINSIKDASIK